MQTLAVPYAVSSLIIFVSLPLIFRKIPKNRFYGFRTRKTMSGSDEYWYSSNRSAGFAMFLAGVVSFVACLLIPLFVPDPRMIRSTWSYVAIASIVCAFGYSLMKERKSAR